VSKAVAGLDGTKRSPFWSTLFRDIKLFVRNGVYMQKDYVAFMRCSSKDLMKTYTSGGGRGVRLELGPITI
jgi:hypothetical protein